MHSREATLMNADLKNDPCTPVVPGLDGKISAVGLAAEPLSRSQEAMLTVLRRAQDALRTYQDQTAGLRHTTRTTAQQAPLQTSDLEALQAMVVAGQEDEARTQYRQRMEAYQDWLVEEAQGWEKVAQEADTAVRIAAGIRDAAASMVGSIHELVGSQALQIPRL